MFTLPPRPPKNFILEDVSSNQQSGQEFTPDGFPRVTQTNLAKFCAPVEDEDEDTPGEVQIQTVLPSILEKWTNQWRAYWVPQPGENAYYLHDIYKKHTVLVDPDYNPIYKHMPKIFCRSSKYELDCLEEVRQDKIQRKMERERRQSELRKGIKTDQDKDSVETPVIIVPCKHQPPFWWKQEVSESEGRFRIDAERGVVPQADKSEYKTEFLRWQKEPDVFAENLTDPCRRRDELALVGLPFRNEAINWYYQNYPPPDIKFRPEKFSK